MKASGSRQEKCSKEARNVPASLKEEAKTTTLPMTITEKAGEEEDFD
jgi:hypothetical protein